MEGHPHRTPVPAPADRAPRSLDEADVHPDPFVQFRRWLDEEVQAGLRLPAAMMIATSSRDGGPSVRTVLLNGLDARGLVFYTNYESRKARDLAENPAGAILFYWPRAGRQVRAEGPVAKTFADESDAYFRARPRESQLSAWASHQSDVVASRAVLEARVRALAEEYRDRQVPRPPHWGGYRIAPAVFEFWQGRLNRLHDRLCYRLVEAGRWRIERLSP
ncbi:MAG TPA: pyridoxamine 5'-phosphate oxidase [bacterium]|nr:pyridoxamine 5'-phosphate oxidase [bacterium]